MNRPPKRYDHQHQQHPHYRQPHQNYGAAVPHQGPPPNVVQARMSNASMRSQGMNNRQGHVPQQQPQQQPQQIQNQQVQQQQHVGGVAVQQHQGYPVSSQGHPPHQMYAYAPPGSGHHSYIHLPYTISPTTNPAVMQMHHIGPTAPYAVPRYAFTYGTQPGQAQQAYYPTAATAPAQTHQIFTAVAAPQYVHHNPRMSSAGIHPNSQAVANAQQMQQTPVNPAHGGVVAAISAPHQPQHTPQQQQPVVTVTPQAPHQNRQEQTQQRAKNILRIIDPKTGLSVLDSSSPSTTSTNSTQNSADSSSAKGTSTTESTSTQNSITASVEKQDTQSQSSQQSQESPTDLKQKDETATSTKEEGSSATSDRNKSSARAEFFQKIAQASDDTRTSSNASSTGSGSTSASTGNNNQAAAEAQPTEPGPPEPEPEPIPAPSTPVPSTPTKEKSPSPEPSKPLVVNTPVANTSSDDSKDASLVSISPTPIENYATPRSRDFISSPPLQPPIEKYAEETAEEEPSEEGPVSEEITEPEATTEPIKQTESEDVSESAQEEVRADSELSDSVKQDELDKDEMELEQEEVIEERQPNGHVPLEEGEIRDDEDDDAESAVADSGNDDHDETTELGELGKGKIKYDRDTLMMIGHQHNIKEFKVIIPDLAKDNLNNHIKSHGTPMKNSPGGPRQYDRVRGMPNQGNKGPLLPHQGLGHIRMNMGIGGMTWGGGMVMPPPPPSRIQPKVQLTLQREEVKLHKAENAWKPSTLKRSATAELKTDEESIMVDSIVKQTRGILNKLTPDNFDNLVSKFMALPLEDKDERISKVIGVVFEKAIDEPSFSTAYARMVQTVCKTSLETSKKFRKQILDQCQKEFQKNNTEEAEIKDVEQKLEETTDEESRELLKTDLEEKKFLSRRRSLGNVRFIGELYKLQMLTPKIMVECVQILLHGINANDQPDEEKLECLCKLLTTVGQRLDMQLRSLEDAAARGEKPKFVPEQKWMGRTFGQLHQISEGKKLSSRIRFAILDVVELRENDWKPRRDSNAPTTIAEVRKEAFRQEQEEKRQINNLPPVQNNYGGGDRDRAGGAPRPMPQQKKSDWTTSQPKTSRFQAASVKKTEPVGSGTPVFGPPQWGPGGQQWGSKPQSGAPKSQIPPRFMNRFQSLSVEDGSRHHNRGASNSSDSSGSFQQQQQQQQHSMFPQGSHHPPPSLLSASSPPPSISSSAENSRPVSPKDTTETFTADAPESVKNIFKEYLSCRKFDDTLHWIKTRFPGKKIDEFVDELCRQVGEMSKEAEQKCAGSLVRLLIKNKEIPKETVIKLMAEGIMEELPDVLIDSPMATTYLAQFLVEVFSDEDNLNWLVQVGDRLILNEEDPMAWKDLAVNSLKLLKLRNNEEFVQTSFRQTERKNVIPVDDISWLQDKTADSLAEQMVKVLSPKLNSESSEEIGQIFQENSWDVREEITARALTEAICMLTLSPETGNWNDGKAKKLLPLLALPNQNMLPIVWKQVEDYLKRKSLDKKKGEGLWNIMYSLNMTLTTTSSD